MNAALKDVIIIAFLTVGLVVAHETYQTIKFIRLKRKRNNEDYRTFIESFKGSNVPIDVLNKVYSFVQYNWIRNVPVHPDDDLVKVWSIDPHDIEDIIVEYAKECDSEALNFKNFRNVVYTVSDLVNVLAKIKCHGGKT